MKKWKQYLHIQPWEKQEDTHGSSISLRKRLAGFGVGLMLLVGFFSINTNSFSIVGRCCRSCRIFNGSYFVERGEIKIIHL